MTEIECNSTEGHESAIATAIDATKHREGRLLRESRRVHFIRAAFTGVAAGCVAVLFRIFLNLAEQFRDSIVPSFGTVAGIFILIPISVVLVGIARWLVVKYAPETAGSGIPQVKAALLELRSIRGWRVILVKFVGGVCALGAGLSLGREGPTVQIGAAIGERISSYLKVPRRSRRQLIACGAGAGLAAAFNAPLAGFIFVIEELQRELSPLTYGTAFIAAVASDVVMRILSGQSPDFQVQGYPAPSLSALPLVILTGIVMGFVGVLYNKALMQSSRKMRSLDQKRRWQVVLGIAVLAAVLVLLVPLSAGSGRLATQAALSGDLGKNLSILFLVSLLCVKFSFTIASYATGVPGGIFAPMLAIGSLGGLCLGRTFFEIFPSVVPYPGVFGIISMAALFAASVRAPITGIILILEMTANHEQLFAVAVASLCAYIVAEQMREKPIYESLLEFDLAKGGAENTVEDEAVMLDLVVESGSFADGKRLRDLGLPPGSLVVLVRRAGKEIVPIAGMHLKAGDEVSLLVASGKERSELIDQSTRVFHGEFRGNE